MKLTKAPKLGILPLHRGKCCGVGFDGLTVSRRSESRALNAAFPMSGRNGRGRPLPVPRGRSVNLLLPGHLFDGGRSGFIRTSRRPLMSANNPAHTETTRRSFIRGLAAALPAGVIASQVAAETDPVRAAMLTLAAALNAETGHKDWSAFMAHHDHKTLTLNVRSDGQQTSFSIGGAA